MSATQSPTAKAGRVAKNPLSDGWIFRAPRHGDLVVCPYCDADTFTCDHCGGERRLYANEVFQ
jgi:hypothetical protein